MSAPQEQRSKPVSEATKWTKGPWTADEDHDVHNSEGGMVANVRQMRRLGYMGLSGGKYHLSDWLGRLR